MDGEFLGLLRDASVEIIVMAACVWFLTMFLKIPVKKLTAKIQDESKRKMANSLILLIPLLLALGACSIYFGITKSEWTTLATFESALSVWFLSLSMYAVFSRLWIIIKGMFSGKVKIDQNLVDDVKDALGSGIIALADELETDENLLVEITSKLGKVLETKKDIESDIENQDKETIITTDLEIKQLKNAEETLQNKIESIKSQILANRINEKSYK